MQSDLEEKNGSEVDKEAKQWASGKVNGIKSYEMDWNKTKIKEYWKEYFKYISGNASDMSKNRFNRNIVDITFQEKWMKRK